MNPKHVYIEARTEPKDKESCILTMNGTWFVPIENYVLCSKCMRLMPDLGTAERCCVCTYCGEEVDESHGPGSNYHQACLRKSWEDRDNARFDGFDTVDPKDMDEEWAVGTDLENLHHEWSDAVEEILDRVDDGDSDLPDFLEVFQLEPWDGISIDHVIEEADEFFEDGSTFLDGVKELEVAIDTFNEANKDNMRRWTETKKKVSFQVLCKFCGVSIEGRK